MARHTTARILPGRCGSKFWSVIYKIRTAAVDRIENLYPNDPYSTGMMEAILIGEKSKLEKVWTENFRRTGTYHTLVIAGFHVTILADLPSLPTTHLQSKSDSSASHYLPGSLALRASLRRQRPRSPSRRRLHPLRHREILLPPRPRTKPAIRRRHHLSPIRPRPALRRSISALIPLRSRNRSIRRPASQRHIRPDRRSAKKSSRRRRRSPPAPELRTIPRRTPPDSRSNPSHRPRCPWLSYSASPSSPTN